MKANRKFLQENDDAVSPVIAVILMVAITVVLAATVYVWVSGFKSGGGTAPTMSFSKISYDATSDTNEGKLTYQVASISDPNVKWQDIRLIWNGASPAGTAAPQTYYVALAANCPAALNCYVNAAAPTATTDGAFAKCVAGGAPTLFNPSSDTVDAGDHVCLQGVGSAANGKTLTITHLPTQSVLATIVVS